MPLDEQEQINELKKVIESLADEIHTVTTLLIGDKLHDPNCTSLIEDVAANRDFRLNVNKRMGWLATVFGAAIISLFVKSFWASLMALFNAGVSP